MSGKGGFVCIDFSLDRLAVLEVTDRRVSGWTVRMLPSGSLRGGDPVDPKALGAELKAALAEAGITATRARIALSDDAAVVRLVEMPSIPRRHLGGAVRYLAEQETPFPAGRASLAWDVVGLQSTGLKVYMAAAWLDVVQHVADAVRAAGLVPDVVEPRSLALSRAIGRDEAIILDVAHAMARLTYVSRAQAPFVDQLPVLNGAPWETAHRLVARALRSHTGPAPMALLAGELEADADPRHAKALPVHASPVSAALNGHGPLRPPDMPGGVFLASLGLAMRGLNPDRGPRHPTVNLLPRPGRSASRLLPSRQGKPAEPRWQTAAAIAAVVVIWSVVGLGVATLLGLHPHLPLGP